MEWKRRWPAAFLVCLLIQVITAVGLTASDTVDNLPPAFDLVNEPFNLLRQNFRPTEAASCSLKNHVPTAMAYYSGIQPGYRFASYMNPVNCTGTEDYPYAIYFVSMPMFHFTGAQWPLGIRLQIWSALPDDSCAGPQEKLYSRHYQLDSVSFMAPKVGVLRLDDPVCVNGPFYVTIEYDGTTPQPYPSVLFDTILPPVNCVNWGYRDDSWLEWNDFWTGPIAGNFMVWVDGFSNSAFCATDEDTVRTLEGIHQQLDSLDGRRVSVVGYVSDSAEGKLISFYPDYLSNSPLAPRSEAFLVGPQPHDSFAGSLVMATGYLQSKDDVAPISPLDQDELSLYATRWQKILDAPGYPTTTGDSSYFWEDPDICRPNKRALLIGGGPNRTNNHRRYWAELVMAYNTLSVPFHYCPENVTVLYEGGQTASESSIPQSALGWYTKATVDSTLAAIARESAQSVRSGHGGLSLELHISGQASPLGLLTYGGSIITPTDLRGWLQRALDSSVFDIQVTITASNGGLFADALLALDNHSQYRITVRSGAGNANGWSGTSSSPFLQTFMDSANTTSHIGAWTAAATSTVQFTISLRTAFTELRDDYRAWLLANPPGTVVDTVRTKVVADTSSLNFRISEINLLLATSDARPWLWERGQQAYYGYWFSFVVPENGQATFTFEGDTSTSATVTMYEDTLFLPGFSRHKRAVWSWNIPGSAGYSAGNEVRTVLNSQNKPADFRMRCDEPTFTYTARLRTDQPGTASASNPYDFPGFSVGGQAQGNEAMNQSPPAFDTVVSPELPGLYLKDVPSRWGTCGSTELVNLFTVPSLTPWHAAMEVRIQVFQVTTPGSIEISLPGGTNTSGSIAVTTPGTYKFDCGAFTGTGPQELKFNVNSGCFLIDAYSLRSTLLDPPSCCEGTTGNVNGIGPVDLSDLSLMIGYLIGGFAAPTCTDEADINVSGRIDLSDLSLLIVYLVSGGVTLPDCP
ncbi:MAG: dockerin type I repeat-containing protein [bacterium]|nr:dockerin type I repeat-containing protein [bacterium]